MFELDTAAGVKTRREFASSSVPGAVDQPAQITSCVGHRERMDGKGVCFLAVVCVPLSCLQSRPKIQATINRCNFAYRRTALSYLVMLVKFCSGNRFSYFVGVPLPCILRYNTWHLAEYEVQVRIRHNTWYVHSLDEIFSGAVPQCTDIVLYARYISSVVGRGGHR